VLKTVATKLPIVPVGASTRVSTKSSPTVAVFAAKLAVETSVVANRVPELIVVETRLGIVADGIVATSVPIVATPADKFEVDTRVVATRVPVEFIVDTAFDTVELAAESAPVITAVPVVIVVLFRFPTDPDVAKSVPNDVVVADKFPIVPAGASSLVVPTSVPIVAIGAERLAVDTRLLATRVPVLAEMVADIYALVIDVKLALPQLRFVLSRNVTFKLVPVAPLYRNVAIVPVPIFNVLAVTIEAAIVPAEAVELIAKLAVDTSVVASRVPVLKVVDTRLPTVPVGASARVPTKSVPTVTVAVAKFAVDTRVVANRVPDEIVVDTRFGIVELFEEKSPDTFNVDVLKFVAERFGIVADGTINAPALNDPEATRLDIVPAGELNAVVFTNVAIVADVFVNVLTNFTVLLILYIGEIKKIKLY
jgi:hypothetical protein